MCVRVYIVALVVVVNVVVRATLRRAARTVPLHRAAVDVSSQQLPVHDDDDHTTAHHNCAFRHEYRLAQNPSSWLTNMNANYTSHQTNLEVTV